MDVGIEAIKLGWKEYMQQPVLPASLAYVLLCLNVVLTPGSLMTAFLTQRGIFQSLPPNSRASLYNFKCKQVTNSH